MKQTFKDADGHGNSTYPTPNLALQNAHLATANSICTKTSVSAIITYGMVQAVFLLKFKSWLIVMTQSRSIVCNKGIEGSKI